ncbi:MAG: sigma-54-dependent Fis family transcriptional regulator [Bryobacteraceae bacterium]|nr:sigma-54-dependent Fis family transcriptional regulator [Bryobacteraceae bacterium]
MKLLWIFSSRSGEGPGGITPECIPGAVVEVVREPQAALGRLKVSLYDAVVATFPVEDWSPEEFLEEAQRANGSVPVVIHHGQATFADAVRATKLGAYEFLGPDATPEHLLAAVESAIEYRRTKDLALLGSAVSEEPWRQLLVGESQAIQNVAQIIRLVGPRRCTVLISGETGTGKEMVARAIHKASPRGHLPMVSVNCSALPENLLEAELFGHVKGAFTGAIQNRIGRFEQAHRSTLFLDEIGDMPLETQAKLLRVLQEREFQRIGSSETIKVDVRVVAASNVNLAERVQEGRFREDLYYRLNVVPISIPPLRERIRDIPLLVHHFIEKVCRQEGLPMREISPETMDRLCSYHWPGNVRQLENAVEMAVALSGNRTTLYPGDFPLPQAPRKPPLIEAGAVAVPDDGLDFEQTVSQIERNILEQALQKAKGNKKLAADMLRLKRTTLTAKLKSLELSSTGRQYAAHAR